MRMRTRACTKLIDLNVAGSKLISLYFQSALPSATHNYCTYQCMQPHPLGSGDVMKFIYTAHPIIIFLLANIGLGGCHGLQGCVQNLMVHVVEKAYGTHVEKQVMVLIRCPACNLF